LVEDKEKELDWDDDKVLVKTHYSTVSAGTEHAHVVGDKNVEAWRGPEHYVDVLPRGLGYASVGIVEKVGKNVTNLKVGDRVVPLFCGHASHHVLSAQNTYKILYDETSMQEVSVMYISTFSLSGARKLRIEAGESAAVMGCGILGLYAVQFCNAMGATPVIAVDPVKEKREKALSLGVDYAVDPFGDGFAERMMQLTEGRGINAAVEVTGKGQGLDMILDCMARHGRVSLLGCTRNSDFKIDYYRKIHYPGIELIGAHTGARPENDSRPGFWCYSAYSAIEKHPDRFRLNTLTAGIEQFDR
jgi:threonine dehydrogenase-like Zn-dependent dehydrogenase